MMRALAWFLLGVAAFGAMTRIHVIVDTIQMWHIRRRQRHERHQRRAYQEDKNA